MKRTLGLALAAAMTATTVAGTAALAAPNDKANPRAHEVAAQGKDKGVPDARTVDVQVLQFSDFHGHLEPTVLSTNDRPPVVIGTYGGAAYLAGLIDELSAQFDAETKHGVTYTVSSGDSIGGSTFESGLFQDEPTIEILNAIGLTASAVGNHEFDEGVAELMRIVEGGNHPELGQFGEEPYAGTDFPYLAANVVSRETGEPILPPYAVESYKGVKVGFIGVVTDTTSALVSPGGISSVQFLDEATTINRYAAELQAQGVESIVALVHEGGDDDGLYPSPITTADVNAGCDTLTGAILDINAATDAAVDVLLSGHSHNAFACLLEDPAGVDRPVIGPGDWGRVLSETTFKVDRKTKDVLRDTVQVANHVVDVATVTPDAEVQEIVDRWVAKSAVVGQTVIGSATEPITGDSSGNRGIETPMADLVADAILWGTQESGAQIAFMNVGGVRASLDVGDVTYKEAYNVAPFGNLLVTLEMTGQQIEDVLNQQYQPIPARGTRPMLALGVSEGFSYTWDPATMSVVPGSMTLNGTPIDLGATYRVGTLNFLAEGGDSFTAFTEAQFVAGGPEDLANLVAYIRATSPLTAPEDRVSGL
jgi:5'-nucleotidase